MENKSLKQHLISRPEYREDTFKWGFHYYLLDTKIEIGLSQRVKLKTKNCPRPKKVQNRVSRAGCWLHLQIQQTFADVSNICRCSISRFSKCWVHLQMQQLQMQQTFSDVAFVGFICRCSKHPGTDSLLSWEPRCCRLQGSFYFLSPTCIFISFYQGILLFSFFEFDFYFLSATCKQDCNKIQSQVKSRNHSVLFVATKMHCKQILQYKVKKYLWLSGEARCYQLQDLFLTFDCSIIAVV